MEKNITNALWGVIFIALGGALLLDQFDIIRFTWEHVYPLFMLGFALISFIKVANGNKSASFIGTMFLILGTFFFLRNFDIIPYFWLDETWPLFMLAPGIGFIVLYLFNQDDWAVLIPGGILTFMGTVFALETFDVPYDIIRNIKNFWPLVLVLLGVSIIINSLRKQKE